MADETKPEPGDTQAPGNPDASTNSPPAPARGDPLPTAEELARQAAAQLADKTRRDARTAASLLGFDEAAFDHHTDVDLASWRDSGGDLDSIRGLSSVGRARLGGLLSLTRYRASRRLI